MKPTEAMEEQIKVREWIVARITKIEEDVVDSKVSHLDAQAIPLVLSDSRADCSTVARYLLAP